ncbi:MAG TPA: FecR family protein [bacterium]|nr:FecR family protein [bacterium]
MKLKTFAVIGLTLIVTFGLVFIYSTSFATKERVATLINVKGNVKVRSDDQPSWTPATEKMELRQGDQVRTEGGSSAIIRMDDGGTMVKIGPLAMMKVDSLTQKGRDSNTSLDVSVGKAWSRVRKLSGDSNFDIKTPTAVAGVRGTFFSSEVDEASTFDVFNGSVAVSSASNPEDQILVGEKQRTTVESGKNPSEPVAIPEDEYNSGSNGFSDEEFTTSTFDLQISISPQVVEPGQNATVNLQVFKNGQPYQEVIKINLALSGNAIFVDSGSSETEIETDSQGSASLEITSPEKETVTVSAQLLIKVRK